jgi:hypothetical protein
MRIYRVHGRTGMAAALAPEVNSAHEGSAARR